MSAENGPGIFYQTPIFSFGTTAPAVNGGFSFDLPLAAIQGFSNQALAYTSANSQANRAFVSDTMNRSQGAVSATSDRAYQYQTAALGTLQNFGQQYQNTLKSAISQKSRGCFITTAICEAEAKPDDCEELQVLRNFRDTAMAENPEWANLTQHYYEIAPRIVDAINARADSGEIWRQLRDVYLRDAIAAVKLGENEKAISIYREMVEVAQVFAEEKTHG